MNITDPSKRIIINTIAQYLKAIINICLSLYSMRLILDALTIPDYGIYSVVGGVVAMLGFITNALVITTQRHISFYHGRNDSLYVGRIFSNSLFLHLLFGLAIGLILFSLKGWLFGGVLNIHPARMVTAGHVYYITILMLLTTIITAPFKALFIARENIVYVSAVEVFDGVIKLLLAIGLAYVRSDKLLAYAWMMLGIQVLNFAAFSIYGKFQFEECSLTIRFKELDATIIRQLVGFAGWTTFGAGALAARSQGTAVIINHFMGTTVNAAYGVAAQVNHAIFFVSSSIVNAMNPQIMKAEGEGNRKKVLMLAGQESKYSAILLSLVSIPLLMELPVILAIWLKEVPDYTAMFCRFTVATCLCDQFTIGLNAVNQAQGRIGLYTVLMFTPKLLNLPIAWFLLLHDYPLASVMWAVILIEILVAAMRLPFLKVTAGLQIAEYLRYVILPLIPLIGVMLIVSWGCIHLFEYKWRFLLTIPISFLTGLCVAWLFTLSKDEKAYVVGLIKHTMKK